MFRREAFSVLQAETQEKGHCESCAIIDERRQIRKGKDPIFSQKPDIKNRRRYSHLVQSKNYHPDNSHGYESSTFQVREN